MRLKIQRVASGFNENKPPLRSAAVSVDISKAFDAIDHTLLLDAINATNLNPSLKRWTAAYLRGRQCRVLYQGVFSSWRIIRTGVPQGSVLGPILFNFFVSDFPSSASLRESYADDFNLVESDVQVDQLEQRLQSDMDEVLVWADRKRLSIAPSKCHVTLFTPDMARQSNVHPQISLPDGQGGLSIIPLNKKPRLLGVTFDTHFCFGAQALNAVKAAKARLQTLRVLAGTSWGCSKETLTLAYKQYLEPLLTYAAPVWAPNASASSILRLQRVQSAALRVITGCHSATRWGYLNQETEILPVAAKLDLLCSQFLASGLRVSHPSHATVTAPSGPRSKKNTLGSKYGAVVEPLLSDGVMRQEDYRPALSALHTQAVTLSITNLGENHLITSPPPPICDSEASLTRKERCALAQLRSGDCNLLKDYQMRVGSSVDATCPECLIRRHSVTHLFNCDANPTHLKVTDLWNHPVAVINFLRKLSAFASLNGPHPPRPPD